VCHRDPRIDDGSVVTAVLVENPYLKNRGMSMKNRHEQVCGCAGNGIPANQPLYELRNLIDMLERQAEKKRLLERQGDNCPSINNTGVSNLNTDQETAQ
jgi:hypothetical protein